MLITAAVGARARSNRTFMELKSEKVYDGMGIHKGSNRTFMELKLGIPGQSAGFYPVLIVPLWN